MNRHRKAWGRLARPYRPGLVERLTRIVWSIYLEQLS